MHPVQFVVSVLLFLILFFGIGFLLNMLLKTTWFPGIVVYPIVVLLIVSDASFMTFLFEPLQNVMNLGVRFTELLLVDYVILLAGLIGALLSGVTIQTLRSRGYRMF